MFVSCQGLIKAIVRQSQGNCRAVIRQLSDSCKTVILSFLVQPMRLKALQKSKVWIFYIWIASTSYVIFWAIL